MKPRIRSFNGLWTCSDGITHLVGSGSTPKWAYEMYCLLECLYSKYRIAGSTENVYLNPDKS